MPSAPYKGEGAESRLYGSEFGRSMFTHSLVIVSSRFRINPATSDRVTRLRPPLAVPHRNFVPGRP